MTEPRVRREPPRFRTVTVSRVAPVTPRLVRVTFTGLEFDGFALGDPAASVRLLLPPPGIHELVMAAWNGNEFLMPDGSRPAIRTFTPISFDAETQSLELEIVLHGRGRVSSWAETVTPGAVAAISGPGRGYAIADDAPAFLLGGDESAIPAIRQLLPLLPNTATVAVRVEIATPEAAITLPAHPRAAITWHPSVPGSPPGEALVDAVRAAAFPDGTRIWVAGEAAAVQRIRKYLFEELAIPRPLTTVRGYWKHGRAGDTEAD